MRTSRWLVLLLCLPLMAAVRSADAQPEARMWDVVDGGAWSLTVRSIERRPAPLIAGDESTRPLGEFAIFTIDLENRSNASIAPNANDFVLRSATGEIALNQADSRSARQFAVSREEAPFDATIAPGASVETLLVFDIPASAFPLTLEFIPAGRDIRIDECSCSLPSPV